MNCICFLIFVVSSKSYIIWNAQKWFKLWLINLGLSNSNYFKISGELLYIGILRIDYLSISFLEIKISRLFEFTKSSKNDEAIWSHINLNAFTIPNIFARYWRKKKYIAGLSESRRGGRGGMPHPTPDFGRSHNLISTRRGRLSSHYYLPPPQFFRPSYGPA